MGDIVLIVEDLRSACCCRICHEEELESCKSLEAPCACSGTVKFAHRDCIQRWCNEKGNTVCEICLQKFEPGYTAPAKISQLVDAVVTIRGSLEVPRRDMEIGNPESSAVAGEPMLETDYPECSSEANRRFTYCRTMALIFMLLLLVRDLLAMVSGGTENYPFTLMTLLIIRACGIVLPMFVFIRIITAIQNSMSRPHQEPQSLLGKPIINQDSIHNHIIAAAQEWEIIADKGSAIRPRNWIHTSWKPPMRMVTSLTRMDLLAVIILLKQQAELSGTILVTGQRGSAATYIGAGTSLVAELWGMRDGLHLAHELGLQNLQVESDSMVLVNLLCNTCPDTHHLSALVNDCRFLLRRLGVEKVSHNFHEGNSYADCLANLGYCRDFGFFMFSILCLVIFLFN